MHMRGVPTATSGLASVLILCTALAGCIVVPARPYYAVEGPVAVAPPPPREEYIGVAPALGYVWLGGYWGWAGGRHEWVGGRWEAPRQGYHWVPHQWRQEGGGWRLHQGHWDRR
jgi:WXXGXW repeat (2 copies)